MLDIDYLPEDQFLLAGRMLESSVFQPFWNQRVIYHCGGREATILVSIFVISCTLSLRHCQWEKLCSYCYDQKVGCSVAIMSSFIFQCVMNQPWTANHILHRTAVQQILPACHCLLFPLSGKSRHFAQSAMGLRCSSWFTPQDAMYMCGKIYWSGRSPSAEAFSSQGECSRAEGQEGSKSDSPRSKGPRPERHCQSSHKMLGFQWIGWSRSPVFSYRDPLLPSGTGMRRKLVLLAHQENSSTLGHYQLLCNSNLYIELEGENCTETAGIRVWGSQVLRNRHGQFDHANCLQIKMKSTRWIVFLTQWSSSLLTVQCQCHLGSLHSFPIQKTQLCEPSKWMVELDQIQGMLC